MIVLDFRCVRDEAIAFLHFGGGRRKIHDQVRMRVFGRRQRHHIAYRIGVALAKLVDVAEIERAQGARLDANGAFTLRHAVGAAVAFRALPRFRINGRRMIGACDGAIPTADAFVRVDAHKTEFVFMHGPRRAHMHAFGILAMVACERYVIAKRRGFRSSISGELARTAFIVDHAAIFAARGEVIEIDARHLTGATTCTACIVEEEPIHALSHPLVHPTVVFGKGPAGLGLPETRSATTRFARYAPRSFASF